LNGHHRRWFDIANAIHKPFPFLIANFTEHKVQKGISREDLINVETYQVSAGICTYSAPVPILTTEFLGAIQFTNKVVCTWSWRRGTYRYVVVIASAYRTEDPRFESRQGVRFLGIH
jgi:hypothetical protein